VDADGVFNRRYASHFEGRSADIPASQCYYGIKVIGEAVKSGAAAGSEFSRYFSAISNLLGASGLILFEPALTVFDTAFVVVSNSKLTKAKR
jgi:hypothetical protein